MPARLPIGAGIPSSSSNGAGTRVGSTGTRADQISADYIECIEKRDGINRDAYLFVAPRRRKRSRSDPGPTGSRRRNGARRSRARSTSSTSGTGRPTLALTSTRDSSENSRPPLPARRRSTSRPRNGPSRKPRLRCFALWVGWGDRDGNNSILVPTQSGHHSRLPRAWDMSHTRRPLAELYVDRE